MSTSQVSKGTRRKSDKLRSQLMLFLGVIIIVAICNIFVNGKLLTLSNLYVVITHSVYYCILSLGMSFIFGSGLMDLSIGANILLSSNVGALLAMRYDLGYFGLIAGTILSAIILEAISVFCAVILKIPSWISGLGMALVYEAILTIYVAFYSKTEGASVIQLSGYNVLGTMPVMGIIAIASFAITYILFNQSSIGLNLQAIGCNESVANAMGISKVKTTFISAIIGAGFIGLAAVVQISYMGRMVSSSGLGSLNGIFKAIAILLLATSFGRIISVPVGIVVASVLVMGLFNVLTQFGVPSGTGQEMCLGAIIILCGIVAHWNYKGGTK